MMMGMVVMMVTLTSFTMIGLMTHCCIQVADNSWLVQSVDQCPVLPEIVEGETSKLKSWLFYVLPEKVESGHKSFNHYGRQ